MLISLEGVNGVGKSTLLEEFRKKIEKEYPGVPVRTVTSKPSGEEYNKIKHIFEGKTKLTTKMIYDLLTAFVKQQCMILHTAHYISMNSTTKEILIADRWTHSSIVYTCYELIKEAHQAQGLSLVSESCDLYKLYKHNMLNLRAHLKNYGFKEGSNYGFEELKFYNMVVTRFIFRKYIEFLSHEPKLVQKKNLIYPDLTVYIKSPHYQEQLTQRHEENTKKVISRYENNQEYYLMELLYDHLYCLDQFNHPEERLMISYDNSVPLGNEAHHDEQFKPILDKVNRYLKSDILSYTEGEYVL